MSKGYKSRKIEKHSWSNTLTALMICLFVVGFSMFRIFFETPWMHEKKDQE